MPWSIEQRDGKYCVVKQGASAPVPGGCHASRVDAVKHQRALYANEPAMTASISDTGGGGGAMRLWTPNSGGGGGAAIGFVAAVLAPPADWFSTPEANGPQPLTITADGHVTGHLALWNQCHTGFSECVQAPRSDTFDQFHVGAVEDNDGNMVAVGKIVYSTKHADLGMVAATASRHYDDNGHVGAYVRASNGRHGIWLTGAVRPGLDDEGLVTMRANPPSGDWRTIGSRLSLIAALAVPVPGFPVTRAMAASGALILEGYDGDGGFMEDLTAAMTEEITDADTPTPSLTIYVPGRSKEFLRKRAVITASLGGTE